jgi:hypothetical protein
MTDNMLFHGPLWATAVPLAWGKVEGGHEGRPTTKAGARCHITLAPIMGLEAVPLRARDKEGAPEDQPGARGLLRSSAW